MGCFWTFTPNVLEKVGYYDLLNFGVSGNGHTDYTIRCCRAGFNRNKTLFDLYESSEFIAMQDEGYKCSLYLNTEIDVNLIGVLDKLHKDFTLSIENRIYIPYNECEFNILNELVQKKDT